VSLSLEAEDRLRQLLAAKCSAAAENQPADESVELASNRCCQLLPLLLLLQIPPALHHNQTAAICIAHAAAAVAAATLVKCPV
jgi:hypothetical protein